MKLPEHIVISIESKQCDNLQDPIAARIKILNSIVQLSKTEEISTPCPQPLPLAEIMFI